MLALLATATVAIAPPPGVSVTSQMPNLYPEQAACGNMPYHVVDKQGRPVPSRLGELPIAGGQLLVDRKIGECRIITVMRRALPPAADQPNPPPSQYRVQPLRSPSR